MRRKHETGNWITFINYQPINDGIGAIYDNRGAYYEIKVIDSRPLLISKKPYLEVRLLTNKAYRRILQFTKSGISVLFTHSFKYKPQK